MGFTSQSGHVGFKTQSARGTYADPSQAAPNNGIYVKSRQGGMGITRDLLIPEAEIGGNRDMPNAELSEVAYAGDYSIYPRMDSLPTLLRGVMGVSTDSSTGTGSTLVGTHVINSADTLPWISIEEQIANGYEYFHYTDAKVNSLKLTCASKGYLEATVALAAITQTAGNTPVPASNQLFDTTPQIVASNITVTFGGVALSCKSIDHEIKNNLEIDDHRLGQFVVGDITEKRREITTMLKARPTSSALWRQAAYGSPTATGPAGSPTRSACVVTMNTWEVIGTTTTTYSLTINMPVAIIKPFKVIPAHDAVIETDFEIIAFRPNNGTDIATYTVVNGQTATL